MYVAFQRRRRASADFTREAALRRLLRKIRTPANIAATAAAGQSTFSMPSPAQRMKPVTSALLYNFQR
ncbi:hypothetical protein KCP75_25800 [Salmonella enterica subsp. enterica]|nr:hypothetical protein KCP75_25800 [Salmonella enterica subsp. enterica]